MAQLKKPMYSCMSKDWKVTYFKAYGNETKWV